MFDRFHGKTLIQTLSYEFEVDIFVFATASILYITCIFLYITNNLYHTGLQATNYYERKKLLVEG